MSDDTSSRAIRARLERGEANPSEAVRVLALAAVGAATRTGRLDACRVLGDLAGRALGADWEVAERAAFALLEAARLADTATDRRGVLAAMGRGFRNVWLLPFVHRRMTDGDAAIAIAAIHAAGGLGFPALEDAVAACLTDATPPDRRRAAIAALGHMGAMTAVDRLVPWIGGDPDDATAALKALTEIRSPAGRDAAIRLLDDDPEADAELAAAAYLAELGALEVLPVLRRLARSGDSVTRIAASLASRALVEERDRDAATRFLAALSEPDRAVRAVLARRLRTLSVADVVVQAEVMFDMDAAGVVEIIGELREPAVTRYLLELAERAALPVTVRARAIGAVEANQSWEREALAQLAHRDDLDSALRAAAIQAMGAFATSRELLERIGDLAASAVPELRAAVLWAIQVSARAPDDAAALVRAIAPLLDDPDVRVRRRASYVAGNLGLGSLAPALARHCGARDPDDPELRIAAYVALGELRMPGVVEQVVAHARHEDDPRVMGAASNALVATRPEPAALAALAPRAKELIASPDPRLREAGAELAGLLGGAVAVAVIAPLVDDDSPSVRGAATWALGQLAGSGSGSIETALLSADGDADPAVRERAAAGLLRLGTPAALARAIAFVAGDGDETVRAQLAAELVIPEAHAAALAPAIRDALAHVSPDDLTYEPLLRLNLATRPATAVPRDVDAAILAVFPAFAQLGKLPGFDPLVRSVRTAESLFASGGAGDDQSAPITLWMKALENYVHAWLGPRLGTLQREPAVLFDYVDRVVSASWPAFARWLEPRWRDSVDVGGAVVDVPLRQVPNAARELQEHRRKRLDSALSITEWARLLVLFGVDHASGFRNLLAVRGDRTVTLAHRLHTLAAVRNLVTHRANAGASTLNAFRRTYYATFDDLLGLV